MRFDMHSPTMTKDSIYDYVKRDLSFLQLQAYDTVADIGSHDGYYAVMYGMFADTVMFYVNDLNYEPFQYLLDKLNTCTRLRGAPYTCNYKYAIGSTTNTNLPTHQFNKVILSDALHHFSNMAAMLWDIKLIMKDSASLMIREPVVKTVDDYAKVCQGVLMRDDLIKLMKEYGFIYKREEVYGMMAWYEFVKGE